MLGSGPSQESAELAVTLGAAMGDGDAEALLRACRLAATLAGAEGCSIYVEGGSGPFPPSLEAPPATYQREYPLQGLPGRAVFVFAEPPAGETASGNLEAAVALVSLAVLRGRLNADLARREAESTLLQRVGRLIDGEPDPIAALPLVLRAMANTTGNRYAVVLWQPGANGAAVASHPSLDPSALEAALRADASADRPYTGLLLSGAAGCDVDHEEGSAVGRLLAGMGAGKTTFYALGGHPGSLGVLCVLTHDETEGIWRHTHAALAERLAGPLERARLFRMVERAKREWEATFDALAEGVAILDRECAVIRANWAFARMVGTTPREVVGKNCRELFPDAQGSCDECRAMAASEEEANLRPRREVSSQGTSLAVSVYPFANNQGEVVGSVHVLRDVTEENLLTEAVVRSERLRALGELATGVAHSFGNLLVSIGGWAEVLLGSEDPSVQRPANAIQQAAHDGAEAVRRLQDYARSQSGVPYTLVDINNIVRDALELSQPRYRPRTVREGITFDVAVDLQAETLVSGNPVELREVLMNLIFNAIDAMPTGGRLTISTFETGREVTIAVHDNGVGMTPGVKERIFDPFFTTKGQGGSGLGLAIAFGVVERHGGRILVESKFGSGSRFTVVLPTAGKPGGRSARRR